MTQGPPVFVLVARLEHTLTSIGFRIAAADLDGAQALLTEAQAIADQIKTTTT